MSTPSAFSVQVEYKTLDMEIKRSMRRSAKEVVRLGFLLRQMMEKHLWEAVYDCFDEYLTEELHMDYSLATRFMNINRKYSVSGDSMEIAAEYEEYSQGLLIEMLNMPPELEAKVTPDMTVKQVREIKKQAKAEREAPVQLTAEEKGTVIDGEYRELREPEEESFATSQPEAEQQEEKLSPYGLSKTVYPEGSLIATEGCGHLHNCFSCAQDCAIRQKDRYCNEAPLGNPFSCTTMQVLENIRSEIDEQCQFINLDIAKHTAGSNEPDPCCKNCDNGSCGFRCQRSAASKEDIQPELPVLKNNDQRKEWLANYKSWGLWYRDENIDVNYYKYDFIDGSRLVVAEYPQRLTYYSSEYRDEHYYHLLEKNKQGYKKPYDEQYRQQTDSETYLVEFLKNLQKKG